MSEKVVRRSVAIALGIVSILLIASVGGAMTYYTITINDKDATYNDYVSTHSYTNAEYGASQNNYINYITNHSHTDSNYNDYIGNHSYTNDQYNTMQTNYQNELNQYNNYVSDHSYTNGQCNSLNSQNINLNFRVENMSNQINQLNTQINQLNLNVNQYIMYADNFASLHNGANGVYLSDTQISNYYGAGLNWAIDANTTINNLLGTCNVTLTFITQDYTFRVNPSASVRVTMHWESMFQHGVNLSIKSVSR